MSDYPAPGNAEEADAVGFAVTLMLLCFPVLSYAIYSAGYSIGESLVFGAVLAFVFGSLMIPALVTILAAIFIFAIEIILVFYYVVVTLL